MSLQRLTCRSLATAAVASSLLAGCSSDAGTGPMDPGGFPAFVVVPTPAEVTVPGGDPGAFLAGFTADNSGRATTEFWDNESADNNPLAVACNIGFFATGTMDPDCSNEQPGSDANQGGFAGGSIWGNLIGARIDPAAFMFDGSYSYTVTLRGSYAAGTSEVGWFTKAGGVYTFNPVAGWGSKTIGTTINIPAGADWGFYIKNSFNPQNNGCSPNDTDCSDASGGFDTEPFQQFALFLNSAQDKYLVGVEDNKLELMPNGEFHDSDYQDYIFLVEPPAIDEDALFLVIDEDGIDNGPRYWLNSATSFTQSTIKTWSTNDVNDDRPGLAQRLQLRWFAQNVGSTFWFFTGQVGDEGWFAPTFIPPSWASAGPGADGLKNFLGDPTQPGASPKHLVGPGLGTGSDPEKLLDKVPHVIPLRAEGLYGLIGKTVCALVWDSDIGLNYDHDKPELGINGSLKGEKLGVVAFDVLDVVYLPRFSSSTLPRVQVTVRNADEVCGRALALYTNAPKPRSSSEPMDVRPNFAGDNNGYF